MIEKNERNDYFVRQTREKQKKLFSTRRKNKQEIKKKEEN